MDERHLPDPHIAYDPAKVDDSAVLRTEDLMRRIISGARDIEELSDGYAFNLSLEPGLRDDVDELATWLWAFIDVARVQATADAQSTRCAWRSADRRRCKTP